jgi:hypothetical protein
MDFLPTGRSPSTSVSLARENPRTFPFVGTMKTAKLQVFATDFDFGPEALIEHE